MINFTVGPVQSSLDVRAIGGESSPYFRTPEFSNILLESEKLMKSLADASGDSRVIFLTGSGTAGMEAAVMNTLSSSDRALIVNGGSFGARFAEICALHQIPYEEIKLSTGEALTRDHLAQYDGCQFTAFLVNLCETSTGVLYNAQLIGDFCKDNHLFLIVDAISSFLADPFNMSEIGAGVMITGSQKALACPPGVSILVLSPSALERIVAVSPKTYYLDLKSALKNGERGQTPFTPAVTTILQIHQRLLQIDKCGGTEAETKKIGALASYFRERLKGLPVKLATESPSNAVTPLLAEGFNAFELFLELKDRHQMWICPNGGELKEKLFRVGHLGELSFSDYDLLLNAMKAVLL